VAQPTPYSPSLSFSTYASQHASAPFAAAALDTELANIARTTGALCTNIALIQRDDGALKNRSVHPNALDAATLNLVGDWLPRGDWATATLYAVRDFVNNGTASYVCAVAHLSGTFATDLANEKWVLVASSGGALAMGDPVADATPGSVLFIDANGDLGEDETFTFDAATKELQAQQVRIYDGAGNAYTAKAVGGSFVLLDPNGDQILNFLLNDGFGGGDLRVKPGGAYGYFGINGASPGNENASYAINTSAVAGSSAGLFANHQSVSGGFCFLDLKRYTTAGTFEAGWREAIVQSDSDSLQFYTTTIAGLTLQFRMSREGSFGMRAITPAPVVFAGITQFYVDSADSHFKSITPGGTIFDFHAGAGTAVWGAITGALGDQTDLDAALSAVAVSATWGDINGTLADQTDLNTALGLKAPLASPTFTGTVTFGTAHGQILARSVDNDAIAIYGGNEAGANLYLEGPSAANTGIFALTANDGLGGTKQLLGKPNGDLQWGNDFTVNGSGHVVCNKVRVVTSETPTGSGTGAAGQITWDADYIYVCTATNTWKRAALTAF
jgi:hypothetical protein